MTSTKADAAAPAPKDGARPAASGTDKTRREALAGALTGLVALPLVVVLAIALEDAVVRADEAPLRSMLGDERYDALQAGEGGFPHYLGRERLAPDVTLSDGKGGTWRMADQRGKVIVLNFWSITCPPCIEELPSLELLAHMTEQWDDVEVVAISTDEGPSAVEAVLPRDPRVTYLYDPQSEVVGGQFGTELYPETWIIDGDGVVRFRYDGARDWSSPLVLDLIERFR